MNVFYKRRREKKRQKKKRTKADKREDSVLSRNQLHILSATTEPPEREEKSISPKKVGMEELEFLVCKIIGQISSEINNQRTKGTRAQIMTHSNL